MSSGQTISKEATTTPTTNGAFQHKQMDGNCTCPIHRDGNISPFTAPLGMEFADEVWAEPITKQRAEEIYDAHHGYMSGDLHNATCANHGLYYQSNLMGAVTWRLPPFSRKSMNFDEEGNLVPEYYSDQKLDDLPKAIRQRAKNLFGEVEKEDIHESRVMIGDEVVEANRVCLGERMANLASCAMARSQEFFVQSEACDSKVDFLITYVRADFNGSMIKALRDKGWTAISITPPSTPGNRETKEIHKHYKWCFACPVSKVMEQSELAQWG